MALLDKVSSGLTRVIPRLQSDRDLARFTRENVQPIAPDVPDETTNKPLSVLDPPAIDFRLESQLALLASFKSKVHQDLFRELREDPVEVGERAVLIAEAGPRLAALGQDLGGAGGEFDGARDLFVDDAVEQPAAHGEVGVPEPAGRAARVEQDSQPVGPAEERPVGTRVAHALGETVADGGERTDRRHGPAGLSLNGHISHPYIVHLIQLPTRP